AQDWKLPLPILEAAAHYYEKEVAKKQDWTGRSMALPMEALADFYGKCVEELGEDVHLALFGNLEPDRRRVVLTALKQRFNAARIEELSQSFDSRQAVHWQKVVAHEVEEFLNP